MLKNSKINFIFLQPLLMMMYLTIGIPAAAAARGHIVCWTTEVSAVSDHMQTSPPSTSSCIEVSFIPSSGSAL